MIKKDFSIPVSDISEFRRLKQKVLNWVRPFNTFCFLDNHEYQIAPHSQECLLGAGVVRSVVASTGTGLKAMDEALRIPSWWFGHLSYDLALDNTQAQNRKDHIGFPQLHFFEPEILIRLRHHELRIEAPEPERIYRELTETGIVENSNSFAGDIHSRMSREDYLATIRQLQAHILRGDCYEINFCQEFFSENAVIDPVLIYQELSRVSPNPFSGLYKLNDRWLICASPERFLKKQGSHIFSQPIKGTATRNTASTTTDQAIRDGLYHSAKDRAENVMVVDLVRNDLARICSEGTVKVDELFGIYSFPQVHQMISTVSGELDPQTKFSGIIEATFPMGSMTGAPKHRVMQLIEQYEWSRRGIFSGALGYINPDSDFDFNVIIRSILYNAATGYLSFLAGSGITFYSEAEREWEECEWKAKAIRMVLGKL